MGAAHLKGPPIERKVESRFGCVGKEAFKTPALAVEVALRRKDKARMHYRCENCGLWHIGSANTLTDHTPMYKKPGLIRKEK